MTNVEAKQALARKLDIDYTNIANNGLFTDADLQDYIQSGVQMAWDRHPWDFTEGAKVATLVSQNITNGYVDYPPDMVTGGALNLVVNSKEYARQNKLNYPDYRKAFEDDPNCSDLIWSEYKRFIFFNMTGLAAGMTFEVYGKLRSTTLSADSDLLPFSTETDNQEDSGNHAIVKLAYAEALASEKKGHPVVGRGHLVDESIAKDGYDMLDRLWAPMAAYKVNQQSRNRPFFASQDFFAGHNGNNQIIGNFYNNL